MAIDFKREVHGADVATIHETEDEVLEVVRHKDGRLELTVHNRRPWSHVWEDLSVVLSAQDFIELGSIADMTLCIERDCPSFGQPPSRSCKCHPRNAALGLVG